jgi:hypothetical protein
MSDLILRCSELLSHMYDPRSGRFSSSTRLEGSEYSSEFRDPPSMRYSINALLGLARAARAEPLDWDVPAATELLLRGQGTAPLGTGDAGLALSLLCELRSAHADRAAEDARRRCEHLVEHAHAPLQEVCWLLSGLCDHVRLSGDQSSVLAVRRLFGTLRRRYAVQDSLFPRHVIAGPRSGIVSFGGVTYFLRSVKDVAECTNDEYAGAVFRELVLRVIATQGPFGEWPWHYDSRTGRVLEGYEIYAVHQVAMAMLFLLPAMRAGIVEAEPSIRRSYRWILGANELGIPMFHEDPFMPYRSIRRRMGALAPASRSRIQGAARMMERGRAWLLADSRRALGLPARAARTSSLEVNSECRSYEVGWMLYVWGGVEDFDEFTNGAWRPTTADGLPDT